MKINQKERTIAFLFFLNYRNYKERNSIRDGKKAQTGRELYGKQQQNKMEGIKSRNIT